MKRRSFFALLFACFLPKAEANLIRIPGTKPVCTYRISEGKLMEIWHGKVSEDFKESIRTNYARWGEY